MIKLEDIRQGLSLEGIEPALVVTVLAALPLSPDSLRLIYTLPEGTLKERLLARADEVSVRVATRSRPWSFDGDGHSFRLAVEARRIDLAFLFDPMMAVHASTVEPLPHQITAVYESLLPRQPLRFVLADDPGAGKTIMAGLYIRELIMRADARRVLIVAPGSLVEQWRDELFEKFGLDFPVFSRELEKTSVSGNPFEEHDQLVVRLDQMTRSDDHQAKACASPWDLVIFDEAHKLLQAFAAQNGAIHPREPGRFEITHVPAALRERDRRVTTHGRRAFAPVGKRYERVCFTKDAAYLPDRPGLGKAQLLHPGHPLMMALTDVVIEQHGNLLRQGAVLVDPADEGTRPGLLFLLTHEVTSGDGTVLSKRLQFVRVDPDGVATSAGWAPHLDLAPLDPADRPLLRTGASPPSTTTSRCCSRRPRRAESWG